MSGRAVPVFTFIAVCSLAMGSANEPRMVVMHWNGAGAKSKDKPVFLCELAYAGVFALGPIIPQDQHQGVLLIECPRLLFPFARAIIADATREGGFPPLTLQPIDFFSLFQQQMQAQQAPRSSIIKP